MNYTEQICQMLKVEQNQPFRIKGRGYSDCWYKINDDCETEWDAETNQASWYVDRVVLLQILRGDLEIERPKKMTLEQIERELGYPIEVIK